VQYCGSSPKPEGSSLESPVFPLYREPKTYKLTDERRKMMATEIRDASGALIGCQLEHTAQQVDNVVDNAMIKSAYDPDNVVALAGGIAAYIHSLDVEEVSY
jgi:hypothetical protein